MIRYKLIDGLDVNFKGYWQVIDIEKNILIGDRLFHKYLADEYLIELNQKDEENRKLRLENTIVEIIKQANQLVCEINCHYGSNAQRDVRSVIAQLQRALTSYNLLS